MKKLFLVLALAVSASTFAQSTSKEDVDIIQFNYGQSKKDIVNSMMKIDPARSGAFWQVYDKYEADRKKLGQDKIKIIDMYAENFAALNDEVADKIAKATLKNNADYEKLYSKYYGKFKSAIGAKDAAKFIQLEVYLQTVIRTQLQESIPLFDQLDKAKTQ